MKSRKFLLSVMGISSLVGSVFAFSSCGTGGVKEYDPTNFLPSGVVGNPYQIVRDPITITIFTPHSSASPKTETMKMFKYLSQITNINFSYNTPDTGYYQNVKAGIWSGRSEIPDLFLFNNDISELVQFAENQFDAYTPLNDNNFVSVTGVEVGNVIENYMPNYKAGLDSNFGLPESTAGNAKKIATLSDGKMYSTLSVNDVARDNTFKMYLNKAWISHLNSSYNEFIQNPLVMPENLQTLDELERILYAFKNYDANGNGDRNDEIPLIAASMKYVRNFLLSAFGHVAPGIEIKDDWSQYEYVPATNAYREYLKLCNKWFADGIIDSKTFSITSETEITQKAINKNNLGSFVHAAAYLCVGSRYQDDYVTIKPVRSSGYSGPLHQWGFSNFKPDGATIPSSSPYVREVARLIDIMYSQLGQELIAYGVENEDWHWDDDSKTSWSVDLPAGYAEDETETYRATLTPNVNTGAGLYWSKNFVEKQNDPVTSKLNELSSIYVPYLKVPEPYEIKMTADEYAEVGTIKAGIDDEIIFQESQFIKGMTNHNPNVDADWNAYISVLERFQYRDMLKCYNDALARYKGNSN